MIRFLEIQGPGLSHFRYRNNTKLVDGPVDPASEQNHMGPPGQRALIAFSSSVSPDFLHR